MHQENIQFSACFADSISWSHEDKKVPRAPGVTLTPPPAREDNRAATQEGRALAQNKVLVIMDYGIFRKQAYHRTGSQRDSSVEVTDSIQEVTWPSNWDEPETGVQLAGSMIWT
jgi:hypothetical protein